MKAALTIIILFFSILFATHKYDSIKVLILQTSDHHDTKLQAEAFKTILEKTGPFEIDIVSVQEHEDWERQNIILSNYQLVVSSGFGADDAHENNFLQLENFISEGGGLVLVHQGVASFQKFPKFQEIIGKGWYGSHTGPHTYWDPKRQSWAETPVFHGVGAAHGKQHELIIDVRNKEHPITKGMPLKWKHGMDEFYHGMRGSSSNIEILATSYSDKQQWGSGEHEPIAWTSTYGKGRVFVTVLGHVFDEKYAHAIQGINSSENGTKALYCVGFQTLLARSFEWVATGKVTSGIPANFPNEEAAVILPPTNMKWPK
jgi:type 1 glutamine amidotransferase